MTRISMAALSAAFLMGCGDSAGPVDSGIISILVDGIEESDIDGGVLSEDESIATQSGNPWGEFVDRARVECEGDPEAFTVTSVSAEITSSSNVSGYEDFVSGTMVVYFQDVSGSDAAATRVDVASASAPNGTGPVDLAVTATRSSLNTLLSRLVGGDFHLGWRAPTDKTETDDFGVAIRVRLSALAHCG